ncbi:hypothetical protein K525DRAFT_363695 [Schizophyllum commune Loenen D]|nr:hypothetical protein K525DRAFT_363695 [Schizophyllum commune Loenen D]
MTAIRDADKAEEKQPLVEKNADAKVGYDASDSDGDEHRSDEESDEDTAHRQRVREERKRMEDALAKDERFTRPAVPVWKRAGLLVALGLLVWAALALREYANRPPTIIYASRYSEEYKYRPAASPIITETLRDGRLRVRGAAPTTSIKPTPTQTPTSKPGRKRRGKKRSKAKKSTNRIQSLSLQHINEFTPRLRLLTFTTVHAYGGTTVHDITLIIFSSMSNSPQKRHGRFCRFRSIIVRRSARFQVTNVQMATGGSFPVGTGEAQYTPPASARGSSPRFSPLFVGGDDHISLPEIPDLPSPTAAQGTLPTPTPNALQQINPDDEPAAQNSLPHPTQQADHCSPAVTYLSLDERLGESDIPSHDLMTDVEYDSALSTPSSLDGDRSPPTFSPGNNANSLPRGRTLARKDGRMPLRPASAGAGDDPTDAPTSMHAPILASDQSHDNVEATKDPESSDGQSAMQETMPETLTHAFVHVGKAPDGRLPGLMLRIVVGSQSAGNPLFDDAMQDASRACAIYGHELTQLSLIILQDVQIDDGRDALNAVLEYLQEHLSFDLQMPKELTVSACRRIHLWGALAHFPDDQIERAVRYGSGLRT